MTAEEKYVAAAYLVIFAVVLGYVVIIALKLQRLERELTELTELARSKQRSEEKEAEAVAVG
jgi:CcmD family protein